MDIQLKKEIKRHFDELAPQYDTFKEKKPFYYNALCKELKRHIDSSKKILEIGCGTGSLLNEINPKHGFGIDISEEMVRRATEKHRNSNLTFLVSDAEHLPFKEEFDYILMIDLIEHLDDVFAAFESIREICHSNTKVIIFSINPRWMIPLHVLEKLKLKMPEGPHNWLAMEDIENILRILDFEIISTGKILLSSVQVIIAKVTAESKKRRMSSSIIIPSYNEEESIVECIKRIPDLGEYEIIVVDDGCEDNTAELVRNLYFDRIELISYNKNQGKGFAVKKGFDSATKDLLIILDADMAVPPEELPRFIKPIQEGKADFVNGTRLIYPMESGAMRDVHLFGNRIFSKIFSWMLGQRITDTLCGTKAIRRRYYNDSILRERSWPDFDLLFYAAKNGLNIVEIPVHYKRRKTGISKMRTFYHTLLLIKMCIRGLVELKLR